MVSFGSLEIKGFCRVEDKREGKFNKCHKRASNCDVQNPKNALW